MCQPVTLATSPVYIQGVAISSTDVYWTDTMSGAMQPAGTIMMVPIDGGTPTTLVSGQDYPVELVADNTRIYWPAGGSILSKVLGVGGAITTIASGQNSPATIAVDSNNAYWSDYLGPDGGAGGTVMQASLLGGPAVTLATGQIEPWGIGVSSTDVYWSNYGGSIVTRVPIGGGSPVTVVSGGPPDGASVGAGGLVVGPTSVYWTAAGPSATEGAVMSVPLGGGTPTTLASGQDRPGDITVDPMNVYWANYGGGQIMTMPLSGGTPTMLASGQAGPIAVNVDATTVYWANQAGGQVMKVAKP